MADARGSSAAGEGSLPDNRLFDLYRTYIGDPDDETDVYLGFGLFFGGIAAAAVGFLLFVFAAAVYGLANPDSWTWTGPAYALGMVSVPAVMVGVVVLLPVEERARRAAMGGGVVTLAAAAFFLWAYPYRFNTAEPPDYTLEVVGLYAVGAAVVIGSTGAALIANQLQNAQPPSFDEVEAMRAESATSEDRESWSEEEIRQDIQEAMSETDINWGGVEKSDTRNLDLQMDEVEVDATNVDLGTTTTRMEGVDNQVSGLKEMKAGERNTETAENSTVDDQTAKLNQLKQQKKEGEAPDSIPGDDDDGVVDRIKGILD